MTKYVPSVGFESWKQTGIDVDLPPTNKGDDEAWQRWGEACTRHNLVFHSMYLWHLLSQLEASNAAVVRIHI